MKTVLASLALTFLVSFTSLANGEVNPVDNKKASMQTAVYPSTSGKINVIVENASNRNVVVRVLNSKGVSMTEQSLGKSAKPTHSRFDMSELADGVYQVEISNGVTKEVKQVTLKTEQPSAAASRTIALN